MKYKPVTRQNSLKRVALALLSLFLTLGLIEIILRVTHLATDVTFVEGDPVLGFKFIPNQSGTFVVGKFGEEKARYNINSDGWNAVRNYREKRDQATTRIAVIGDSYVEALNVPPDEAVAAVLERALSPTTRVEVYSFGISGASLSHYLAMMRYVRSRFSPDLYVINVVHNDFEDSLATAGRAMFHSLGRAGDSYEEVTPEAYRPSLFRRIIGHFAIARYLNVNLKVQDMVLIYGSWRKNQHQQFEANIPAAKMDLKEMRELVNYLFKKYLHEVDNDGERIVIVLDSPREPIYKGTHPETTTAFEYNKLTAKICRDLALYCLDLTDPFFSDFQQNRRRFNSEIDGHWNAYGHEVVAKAMEDFLLKNGLLFSTR